MTRDDKEQAIFGGIDGLTSTVAIVVAAVIAGTQRTAVATGFSIAIAAGIGMGYSEYVSDPEVSLRRAGVMGSATLASSAIPVLPFLFAWEPGGILASAFLSLFLAVCLSILRSTMTEDSGSVAVAKTLAGIVLVGALCTVPSFLTG